MTAISAAIIQAQDSGGFEPPVIPELGSVAAGGTVIGSLGAYENDAPTAEA
ncbi:MAG: hypothetical protein RIC85_05915 [Gammaproteobacteria bacterium]